jgi:glutathione synthase/RimK-type ligase-like ATP-grasp enzyme
MKKVAYLTMDDMGDFVTDFQLSFEPMAALGWHVETVDWQSDVDWDAFDAVYICTPWDYPDHLSKFIEVLATIDDSRALLLNELSLVQWTLDKHYLRDLEASGHDIVPTTWHEDFAKADADQFFVAHGSERVVIKPAVGANARDTFVLHRPIADDLLDRLQRLFSGRAFLVQPYIETIETDGEYSLFFFNGEYSHAIQKIPKAGDFRVQEEHGADIRPARAAPPLLRTATRLFASLKPVPTYGRGDWVRGPDGRYRLMELELIEPSLYLRTDSAAAARFARAFDQRFEELAGIRTRR